MMYQDGPKMLRTERPRILTLFADFNTMAQNRNMSEEWASVLTCGTWLTEMAEGRGLKNVRTVVPGVEPEFQPTTPDPLTIGVLAHEKPDKNTQLAVDAIKEVVKTIPDAKLIGYGSGNFDLNEFHRQPKLAQIASIYQRCSIWIMPWTS